MLSVSKSFNARAMVRSCGSVRLVTHLRTNPYAYPTPSAATDNSSTWMRSWRGWSWGDGIFGGLGLQPLEVISPVQRSAALRSGAANMALISDRVRNPTSFHNLQLAAVRGLPFAPRHPKWTCKIKAALKRLRSAVTGVSVADESMAPDGCATPKVGT
jgi:hypothetical protein